MNANARPVWLGFRRTGGRLMLGPSELRPGVNVVGPGADSVASSLASACVESGLRTLVIDLEGRVARLLAGRFDVAPFWRFLYDSQKMEERAGLHAELAASAYTISLNLNFEQEAFLNSAIQYIAMEGGVASPVSLNDRLNAEGEFRGHTADELRGKLWALRSLNLTGDDGAVRKMTSRDSVAHFAPAESRQAGEVAAMLLVAKLIAISESGGELPDVLVITGANRVFTDAPLTRHGNRLLTALLSAETATVLASETTYGLDRNFLETSPVRILSGSVHNGRGADRFPPRAPGRDPGSRVSSLILTPNMHVIQDLSRGYEEVFVPRDFVPMGPPPSPEPEPGPKPDETGMTKKILETFAQNANATRGSVVGYLSADEPREALEEAIDRLHADGFLVVVGKDVRRDSPIQAFRLTQKGYDELKRLG